MKNKSYRRRNYFIKKSFQTRFSLRFVLLIMLEALLIAGLFWHVAKGTLTTGYSGTELRIEKTASFFYVSFVLILLIASLAIGLVGMLVFIFYSHRIAGPLFRFQRSLQEISGGDLTGRIRLRQKDQLGELGESINLMTKSMDQQIGKLKKEIETASQRTGKESLARLKETADFFKTSA
ncbi:MAG: hypothetical protein AUJ71_04445 [Candidatus Omnitrophica bacterium CG1_02_49_16]|nr:MAG: hypothetical protein AUJ71_04445 [Candidatus Omnitrophica bacterium CG1_02_49_16]